MKRTWLTFFLILIVQICIYSQNTSIITITSEQLRTTNLIFAEHKKFSEQLPLLEEKINNLELINDSWKKSDSIKTGQLYYCKNQLDQANMSIDQLNNTIKIQRNVITYGTAGSIIVVLLCLLVN